MFKIIVIVIVVVNVIALFLFPFRKFLILDVDMAHIMSRLQIHAMHEIPDLKTLCRPNGKAATTTVRGVGGKPHVRQFRRN